MSCYVARGRRKANRDGDNPAHGWWMSYYVARNMAEAGQDVPYVVLPARRNGAVDDVVKTFTPVRDASATHWNGMEPDWKVHDRAQAFCNALNAGGMARERALRSGKA